MQVALGERALSPGVFVLALVVFSILVQGLSLGPLVRRAERMLEDGCGPHLAAPGHRDSGGKSPVASAHR